LRPPAIAADLDAILDLIDATPALSPHRLDAPWRLGSLALRSEHDARLCEDAAGVLLGLAAWQPPWATLDLYLRPGPWQKEVEERLFDWALDRFRELDRQRGHRLPYWVGAVAGDVDRLGLLERQGYTLDDGHTYVSLTLSLSGAVGLRPAPAGFTIRPFRGAGEVDACVALHRAAFQSEWLTPEWRLSTLHSAGHDNELDLVAIDSDGALAAFCVCWLARDGHAAQIEPIAVHPRYQGLGLATALMHECFHRLRERGAGEVRVETESTRTPARRAYESAGFRVAHTIVRRGRWATG
jgi:mycothiol synthase